MIKVNLKKVILISFTLVLFSACENSATSEAKIKDGLTLKNAVQSECVKDASLSTMRVKAVQKCSVTSSALKDNNLTITVRQNSYCSSKFKLESKSENGKITLKADDTATEAVRCMCDFDLTYTFTGAKEYSYKFNYTGKALNADPCIVDSEVKK